MRVLEDIESSTRMQSSLKELDIILGSDGTLIAWWEPDCTSWVKIDCGLVICGPMFTSLQAISEFLSLVFTMSTKARSVLIHVDLRYLYRSFAEHFCSWTDNSAMMSCTWRVKNDFIRDISLSMASCVLLSRIVAGLDMDSSVFRESLLVRWRVVRRYGARIVHWLKYQGVHDDGIGTSSFELPEFLVSAVIVVVRYLHASFKSWMNMSCSSIVKFMLLSMVLLSMKEEVGLAKLRLLIWWKMII